MASFSSIASFSVGNGPVAEIFEFSFPLAADDLRRGFCVRGIVVAGGLCVSGTTLACESGITFSVSSPISRLFFSGLAGISI